MKETNVTIISTNLNKSLIKSYKDYQVIEGDFKYKDLIKYKKIILFNNINNLSEINLNNLFKFIKKNNICFIVCTNNLEISLYTDYLVVCDKENILAEGKTLEVLKNDRLLKRLGFELPFYIDLSILLKEYGLINELYLTKESLAGKLWT